MNTTYHPLHKSKTENVALELSYSRIIQPFLNSANIMSNEFTVFIKKTRNKYLVNLYREYGDVYGKINIRLSYCGLKFPDYNVLEYEIRVIEQETERAIEKHYKDE